MRALLTPFACVAITSASRILVPVADSYAASFGSNLILNPAAEVGSAAVNDSGVLPPPSWQTTSNFTQIIYGASSGFPLTTSPGPAKRDKKFFAGGPSNALSTAAQLVNIWTLASPIDGGDVTFTFSGFFGGYASQNDNAVVNVNFLDAAKKSLRQLSIGSVMASDRANQTGLLRRELRGSVPKKSRFIRVTLTMTRISGSYNDGYADNLSLVLTRSPQSGVYSQELEH